MRSKAIGLIRGGLIALSVSVSGFAHASEPQASLTEAAIDETLAISGEELSVQCDLCQSNGDFAAKALATYPRASHSMAYVFNLTSGEIRSVTLDYDQELRRQLGGQVDVVHPALQAYVRTAGEMYRRNNNSLAFDVVLRADGSVYWKPQNGAAVELADVGLDTSGQAALRNAANPSGMPPGVGSPIDLRGFQFPADFLQNHYPGFPETSYDAAFGQGSISLFVRDQLSHLNSSPQSGVFNGTHQTSASPGLSIPLVSLSGGVVTSRTMTARVSVYVPMRDGGYMIVFYDLESHLTEIKDIHDSQGNRLPPGNGNAQSFLPNNPLFFFEGPRGQQGLEWLLDWAHRNGISMRPGSTWAPGVATQCHSAIEGGVMVVSCRLRN